MITLKEGHALVIDDEPANRDFVERLLQTAGFKVTGAANGADGLKAARGFTVMTLALVDQELPDSTGLEIIKTLRQENPECVLVMATMHDDRPLIDEAFDAGVDVFLVKPHGFMELYRRLQDADTDTALVRRLIIDQYGPRPYRGSERKGTQELRQASHEEITRPNPAIAAGAAPGTPATPATTAPTPAAPQAVPAAPVTSVPATPAPTVTTTTPAPVAPASTPTPTPVTPANPVPSPALAPAATVAPSTPTVAPATPEAPKSAESKPDAASMTGDKGDKKDEKTPGTANNANQATQNADKQPSMSSTSSAVDTSLHRPVSPTDKTLTHRPNH